MAKAKKKAQEDDQTDLIKNTDDKPVGEVEGVEEIPPDTPDNG